MSNVTVIGAQWGDEGKGKIVDWLARRAEIVVRFQGGHNAGHTLVVGNQTYKLSLLPGGLVRGELQGASKRSPPPGAASGRPMRTRSPAAPSAPATWPSRRRCRPSSTNC